MLFAYRSERPSHTIPFSICSLVICFDDDDEMPFIHYSLRRTACNLVPRRSRLSQYSPAAERGNLIQLLAQRLTARRHEIEQPVHWKSGKIASYVNAETPAVLRQPESSTFRQMRPSWILMIASGERSTWPIRTLRGAMDRYSVPKKLASRQRSITRFRRLRAGIVWETQDKRGKRKIRSDETWNLTYEKQYRSSQRPPISQRLYFKMVRTGKPIWTT
ncbi:hypothetical protein IWW34DRAFT_758107 [Fusarium oxysporum f. sp. albedinis]|nr:hypothetical protein IWW34DRAFT_758107 [Fusarium oxysporum f. sp. albedinis]